MDDRITEHQPQVVDLTASDSSVSSFDSDEQRGNDMETEFFTSARRYLWYRNHFLELLDRLVTDACELQLHAFEYGSTTFEQDKENLVDNYLWKLMDNDLRNYQPTGEIDSHSSDDMCGVEGYEPNTNK